MEKFNIDHKCDEYLYRCQHFLTLFDIDFPIDIEVEIETFLLFHTIIVIQSLTCNL